MVCATCGFSSALFSFSTFLFILFLLLFFFLLIFSFFRRARRAYSRGYFCVYSFRTVLIASAFADWILFFFLFSLFLFTVLFLIVLASLAFFTTPCVDKHQER